MPTTQKPKKLKMMKEPDIPVRDFLRKKRLDIISGIPIKTLFKLNSDGIIEFYYGNPVMYYPSPETEDEFNARMRKYEDDRARYDLWYNENKEELDAREALAKQKKVEKLTADIARLGDNLKKNKDKAIKLILAKKRDLEKLKEMTKNA